MNASERDTLLRRVEAEIREITRERFLAAHEEATGGLPDANRYWDDALLQVVTRPEYARALDQESDSGIPDDEERRIDLHRRRRLLLRVEGQSSLHTQVTAIRDEKDRFDEAVGSSGAAALHILRSNEDRARREDAWFRQVPLAESLEVEVRTLLESRNALSREAGCSDYAELAYHASELSRLDFMSLCDELEQLTRPVYEQFLTHARESLGLETLEPWDLEYALARVEPGPAGGEDMIRELSKLAAGLGIDDTRLPALDSSRGAAPHLFPIDPPEDVRLLVGPPADYEEKDRVLREFGRGVFRKHLKVGGALQWVAPCYDLATGEVFVELASGPAGTGRLATEEEAWRTWRSALLVRRALAASLFEMLAYERPQGDLHSLYSEVQEHYLGFPRHPERLWIVQDFLVGEPLAAPNYIMSRLIGAQVLQAVGPIDEHTGVRLAENFWKDGARLSWHEKLRLSTGRPLDPEAFLLRNGIPDLS